MKDRGVENRERPNQKKPHSAPDELPMTMVMLQHVVHMQCELSSPRLQVKGRRIGVELVLCPVHVLAPTKLMPL
jgi:hypothetical protein